MGMQFEMSWRLHIQQPCPFESSCSIVVIYNNYHYNRCSVIGSFCVGNCENYVLAMLEGIMYLPSEDYIACITPVIRYHVFRCQKAPFITPSEDTMYSPVRRNILLLSEDTMYSPVRRHHTLLLSEDAMHSPVRRHHILLLSEGMMCMYNTFPRQKIPRIAPVRIMHQHSLFTYWGTSIGNLHIFVCPVAWIAVLLVGTRDTAVFLPLAFLNNLLL